MCDPRIFLIKGLIADWLRLGGESIGGRESEAREKQMFSFVTTVPQMSSSMSLALLFLVLAVGDSSRVRRSSDDDDLPGDISVSKHVLDIG